jgi:limonene 1,2-monooxygenase
MLGVGPGLLTSDAYMLGIETTLQRPRMNEALDAIMALLGGETVSTETEWFTLRDARLQLSPYTKPRPHIAVATSFTPSGPGAAGRHGLGLLSVAGADDERFNRTWGWVEEAAEQSGATVSRADWKVVVTFHLAETREQAIEDLRVSYPSAPMPATPCVRAAASAVSGPAGRPSRRRSRTDCWPARRTT